MKIVSSAIEEVFLNCNKYYENIKNSEEYIKYSDDVSDLNEKLSAQLNEEQKKILSDLLWACMGMEATAADTHFAEGIKIGLRLAAECFLC